MMNKRVGNADYGLINPEESRWCYISVGGGGSKQNSSSSSSSYNSSGVSDENRDDTFETLKKFLTGMTESTMQFNRTAPMLNTDASGLTPETSNLLKQMVSLGTTQEFNKLSAGGAADGKLSPKNTPGLIASATARATANALPQFLPISQGNTLFNATSKSNTLAKGIEQLQGIASIFAALATGGSEGTSTQRSKGKSKSGEGNFSLEGS